MTNITHLLLETSIPIVLRRLNQKVRRGEAEPLREAGMTHTTVTSSALINGEAVVFTFTLDYKDQIAVAVTAQRDGLTGKGLGTFSNSDEALAAAVAACDNLDRILTKSVS